MRSPAKYPSIFKPQATSVLTPAAQRATQEVGQAKQTDADPVNAVKSYRTAMNTVPANAMPQAVDEIQMIAGIGGYWVPRQPPSFLGRLRRGYFGTKSPEQQLEACPSLGWLLIFHHDGRLREKALYALPDAPQCPFEFTAICYRLNDWAAPVRRAAETYAERQFPNTKPRVIAECALFLLELEHDLGRWTTIGRSLLHQTFSRSDVAHAMADALAKADSGRYGYVLQQLLRGPELDPNLPELARNAVLPGVRRVATETLLRGTARWFTGWSKQWVDKSLGRSRRVPDYGTRAIATQVDFDATLMHAAQDRSAMVREVAADALIENRHNATSVMDNLAKTLAQDKRPSVRSRAAFYLHKREGDT